MSVIRFHLRPELHSLLVNSAAHRKFVGHEEAGLLLFRVGFPHQIPENGVCRVRGWIPEKERDVQRGSSTNNVTPSFKSSVVPVFGEICPQPDHFLAKFHLPGFRVDVWSYDGYVKQVPQVIGVNGSCRARTEN